MELLRCKRLAFANDGYAILTVKIDALDRTVVLVRHAHIGPVNVFGFNIDDDAIRDSGSSPAESIRAVAKFFFKDDCKFFVKGITYGPFKPDAAGNYLGPPERVAADLANVRALGFNVLRVYHSPPLWFLDSCAAAELRVLVTLPWAKHIE